MKHFNILIFILELPFLLLKSKIESNRMHNKKRQLNPINKIYFKDLIFKLTCNFLIYTLKLEKKKLQLKTKYKLRLPLF